MTYTDIIAAIRRQTLVGTSEISDTAMGNILRDGVFFVGLAAKWPFLQKSATFGVTANQREYTIKSAGDINITDFMFMETVVDNDKRGGKLTEISFSHYLDEWGGDPIKGTPTSYYLRGDGSTQVIGLVPVPSATEATAFTMYYYKTPAWTGTLGDSPEWTAQLHHILIDWGKYRVYERLEMQAESSAALSMFTAGIMEMRMFYKRRGGESPLVFGAGVRGGSYFNERLHVTNW